MEKTVNCNDEDLKRVRLIPHWEKFVKIFGKR